MRLIDADELIEMAYRMRLDSREQIACMIESAPTIEPEQKHGRWLSCATTDLMCSNCLYYWIPKGDQYDYHYCPNCGARMEDTK